MCALRIYNADVETPLFCIHSVSGYLTGLLTNHRTIKGDAGAIEKTWRVTYAGAGYVFLFTFALVETVTRIAFGCIASCLSKEKNPLINDLAWVGAGICLDTALRTLVGLVKNIFAEKLQYEDLFLYPCTSFEQQITRQQEREDARRDAARIREFQEKPKGFFADCVETPFLLEEIEPVPPPCVPVDVDCVEECEDISMQTEEDEEVEFWCHIEQNTHEAVSILERLHSELLPADPRFVVFKRLFGLAEKHLNAEAKLRYQETLRDNL